MKSVSLTAGKDRHPTNKTVYLPTLQNRPKQKQKKFEIVPTRS